MGWEAEQDLGFAGFVRIVGFRVICADSEPSGKVNKRKRVL